MLRLKRQALIFIRALFYVFASAFANLSSLSCHQGSWTPWYNNDTPEGEGDDESLQSIRSRYPGAVCEFPSDFQARVASTGLAIDSNSNNVFASRLTGLECLNIFGPPGCEDYEIRFCCPQSKNFDNLNSCLLGSCTTF